jgi:SsrA-binding protein
MVAGMTILAEHRKARFEYEILEVLEAGLVLQGTEVKSIRDGRISLKEGFVSFFKGEAWLESVHVTPYVNGGYATQEAIRARKLLLHKQEIKRWQGKVQEKGLTAIPLKIYLKNGKIKCEIALAKGKKLHDKRETLKRKVLDREVQTAIKSQRWQ